MPGIPMKRIAVFVDYQNVYMGARKVFFKGKSHPSTSGQIDPGALGELLTKRIPDGVLEKVFVYRAMPAPADTKNHSATRKQISKWSTNPLVEVKTLPLRYPKDHEIAAGNTKPREKGIDVLLAIDFVTKAFKKEFDIGIIFSLDTDLKPALQFVEDPLIKAIPNVAAWGNPKSADELARRRLSTRGNLPFCHWLDLNDFQQIADMTSYTN